MTSPFLFPGGAANLIKQVISGTGATTIVLGTQAGQYNIVWLRCNEVAGGTPSLTVEINDGTTSFYLGSAGSTWKAKAMTAGQSVLFDDGLVVPQGSTLKVTASVGNQVQVTGLYVGKQREAAWAGPGH